MPSSSRNPHRILRIPTKNDCAHHFKDLCWAKLAARRLLSICRDVFNSIKSPSLKERKTSKFLQQLILIQSKLFFRLLKSNLTRIYLFKSKKSKSRLSWSPLSRNPSISAPYTIDWAPKRDRNIQQNSSFSLTGWDSESVLPDDVPPSLYHWSF